MEVMSRRHIRKRDNDHVVSNEGGTHVAGRKRQFRENVKTFGRGGVDESP